MNVIKCVTPEEIEAEFKKTDTCSHCSSQFEFVMADVYWDRPYQKNGWTEYSVICPCCKEKLVPYQLFDKQGQVNAYLALYSETNNITVSPIEMTQECPDCDGSGSVPKFFFFE